MFFVNGRCIALPLKMNSEAHRRCAKEKHSAGVTRPTACLKIIMRGAKTMLKELGLPVFRDNQAGKYFNSAKISLSRPPFYHYRFEHLCLKP